MSDAIEIRVARTDEYAAIDALIREAYAHDYGLSDESDDPVRRAAVRAEEHTVWVAHSGDGALLGSVTTRRPGGPSLQEDTAADELDLRLLGVAPAARRLGVGAALMHHLIAQARADGWRQVLLKTAPNMVGAHRLYETLGFDRAPERDGLWIGGRKVFDLFTYVLPLAEAAGPAEQSAPAAAAAPR